MHDVYNLIMRALKPRISGLSYKDVQVTFASWELIPLTRNEKLVGVALRKETELHLIIAPEFQRKLCFIKQCKQIVQETIAKYGYADTKVSVEHTLGHRLATILGFTVTGSTSHTVYYKKEDKQ